MKPESKNKPEPSELKEALHLNKLILESAGEGIYGLDAEGMTTFINSAAEKMTGYSAREMIGNCQHKLVHHSRPDGTPYPQKECPIYAAFRKG
ncbi:MAG: PAS domain-containing protein, partial [Nitrospina sp.]|nr:PAS domain-containing protein [Nitrospina sp.]